MKTITLSLAVALLATTAGAANAATSLDLSRYSVEKVTSIGVPEASAVSYNSDRNSLLVIGDEGRLNEYDLNGNIYPDVLDYISLDKYKDPEGVTYIGGGQYVLASERSSSLYRMSIDHSRDIHTDDGLKTRFTMTQPDPAHTFNVSGGANWGNEGLEGVSYDPITGGFFAVKERMDQGVFFINWDANTANGAGTVTNLFDPAKLGLGGLSDISVLSNTAAFDGTDFRSNLLILSTISNKLLEVTRAGDIVSEFDLAGLVSDAGFPVRTIEGLTLDKDGNIYLVSELGGGCCGGASGTLIKLTAPAIVAPSVPEPATWAMMVGGLGLVGASLRRRKTVVAFA